MSEKAIEQPNVSNEESVWAQALRELDAEKAKSPSLLSIRRAAGF
jgi:hypothetical protein